MAGASYQVERITRRVCLREHRARWLVRSVPDRPDQRVYYRARWWGYEVIVEVRRRVPSPLARFSRSTVG